MENEKLNFEFPLFARKQLNKWRPPWGWPQTDILGRDKSQLTWQMSLGMQLYVPANLLLISECQQIRALHPFQTKKKNFFFCFHFRGAECWGTPGQDFTAPLECLWLSSAGQQCLSTSGTAGWSFPSKPQQWGISLSLLPNMLNGVCPARSR